MEISFKRDGAWKSAVFLRSMVFQARNIVNLADMGCTITSENAKQLVSFLSALEAENFDILAPVDSTSTFGWQAGGRFIPGQAGGIRLDVPLTMQRWAGGYSTKGTLEGWWSRRGRRGRIITGSDSFWRLPLRRLYLS